MLNQIGASVVVGAGPDTQDKPAGFALFQNVPNPFNPETTIRYRLAESVQVRLDIYDVTGQLVRSQVAGEHRALWNGRDNGGNEVSSGIYFYRLKAGDFEDTKRMEFLK